MGLMFLLASALLFIGAFPNIIAVNGLFSGGWLTAIPLLLLLDGKGWRQRLWLGLAWGLLAHGVLVWWLVPISFAGYCIFVGALSLQGALFGLLMTGGRRTAVGELFYLPSAWVVSEYWRNMMLGGFTWGLGLSQAGVPELIAPARFGGVYAVSWLMLLFATACYVRIKRKGAGVVKDPPSLMLFIFPLCVWIAGSISMTLDHSPSERPLRIVLVQPNISRADKTSASLYNDNMNRHLMLSKKGAELSLGEPLRGDGTTKCRPQSGRPELSLGERSDGTTKCRPQSGRPDIIIWPETAFPDDMMRDAFWRTRMETVARNFNSWFIFGSALLSDDGHDLNALLLLDPRGKWRDVYYKRHLVPFSEYLPPDPLSAMLARAGGMKSYHFLPGHRAGLLYLDGVKVSAGVAICSEEGYPALFRDLARQEAGVLVSVLNDGWFTRPEALKLHAAMAVFRAVETGRPLVRAANTGWSGGIDSRGRVMAMAALQSPGWVSLDIHPGRGRTLYVKFGDVFAWFCAGFVIITLMHNFFRGFVLAAGLMVFCLPVSDANAAAAVQRRVQQQREQQVQAAQQYQQQMMQQQQAQQIAAQQQAQQVEAYKQAVLQRQYQQAVAQKQAQEYAAQKQAMEMAVAKKQAEEQQAAQVMQAVAQNQAQQVARYQQEAAYKNAAEMTAYKQSLEIKAYQEAQSQAQLNGEIRQYAEYAARRNALLQAQAAQAAQEVTERELLVHASYQNAAVMKKRAELDAAYQADARRRLGQQVEAEALVSRRGDAGPADSAAAAVPETTVSIDALWNALDRSALPWAQIIDREIKLLTVSEFIDRFRQSGIRISHSPGEYVGKIDSLAANNPGTLQSPFGNLLSYVAIMEYDFENGQNKDELARQVMGDTNFWANKRRLEGK